MAHKIATLDIGSSKTTCIIATHHYDGSVQVDGIGYSTTEGVKKGNIVDIVATQKSIISAINKAEKMADEIITNILVSVPSLLTYSETLETEVLLHHKEITDKEIASLLNIKKQYRKDRKIIHTIPLSYQVDEMKCLKDPRGMIGNTLRATVNVVSLPRTTIENLIKCISYCHLDIDDFVVSPLADGVGTLLEDELNLGAILVNIGAETTEYSVFSRGNLVGLGAVPIGGQNITNDIAQCLNISLADAERIKVIYGNAHAPTKNEYIQVNKIGELNRFTEIESQELIEIIRPRIEEIFNLIKTKMDKKGFLKDDSKKIVLSGGASSLSGIKELVEEIFGKQVRIGKPKPISGMIKVVNSPAFTIPFGLIQYAIKNSKKGKSIIAKQNVFQKVGSLFKKST